MSVARILAMMTARVSRYSSSVRLARTLLSLSCSVRNVVTAWWFSSTDYIETREEGEKNKQSDREEKETK